MVVSNVSDLQDLATRLGFAVARAGGKAKVARLADVPVSSLDRYLKGKSEAPVLTLVRLAKACDVPVELLVSGETDPDLWTSLANQNRSTIPLIEVKAGLTERLFQSPIDADFVLVPRFDVRASAGRGRLAQSSELEPTSELAFRTSWLRSLGVAPEHAEFLTAEGDSMLETIHDGDLLLINRQIDRVVNNAIYVVVLAGAVMVKRLQLMFDGSIMLISDNPRYQPERVERSEVDRLQVEGRVKWYGRAI